MSLDIDLSISPGKRGMTVQIHRGPRLRLRGNPKNPASPTCNSQLWLRRKQISEIIKYNNRDWTKREVDEGRSMSGQLATIVETAKTGVDPVSSAAAPADGALPAAPPAVAPSISRPALKLDQRALLCFYGDPLRPLTIQETQRTLGVTYKPAYQALTGLAARGVLSEERSGWTRSFRPDCSSPACSREFTILEWARCEAFLPCLPDGERERVRAFVRRSEEEATPLFIRTVGSESGDPSPVQLIAVMARPEERPQVALLARETGLSVSVAGLEAVRHILNHRPDLAASMVRGVCLQGAETFVRERFRALQAKGGNHSSNR